jgi:hypothetical protein
MLSHYNFYHRSPTQTEKISERAHSKTIEASKRDDSREKEREKDAEGYEDSVSLTRGNWEVALSSLFHRAFVVPGLSVRRRSFSKSAVEDEDILDEDALLRGGIVTLAVGQHMVVSLKYFSFGCVQFRPQLKNYHWSDKSNTSDFQSTKDAIPPPPVGTFGPNSGEGGKQNFPTVDSSVVIIMINTTRYNDKYYSL